jgi:hypothetical protein
MIIARNCDPCVNYETRVFPRARRWRIVTALTVRMATEARR